MCATALGLLDKVHQNLSLYLHEFAFGGNRTNLQMFKVQIRRQWRQLMSPSSITDPQLISHVFPSNIFVHVFMFNANLCTVTQ